MGLYVSAITELVEAKETDNYDVYVVSINKKWDWKIKELKNKFYFGKKSDIFISYPYSSHFYFRILLYEIGTDENVVDKYSIFEKNNNKIVPFWDLIDFADNEGSLGWNVSSILYRDFFKYKDKAIKFFKDNNHDIYIQPYINWLKIFKIASENRGLVYFE